MAILKGGILGGFTGKIGDVIGYIRFGKSYIKMKSKKVKKKKKPSISQNAGRKNMSVVVKFVNPIKAFVAIGFAKSGAEKKRTAYAEAISYHMLNALTGEYPDISIDFEKVLVSKGQMPGADETSIIALENGLRFNWQPSYMAGVYHSRSRAMLLVFAESIGEAFYNLNAARLMDGTDYMELPASFKGHELHAYISFATDDRKKISNSQYVGSVIY